MFGVPQTSKILASYSMSEEPAKKTGVSFAGAFRFAVSNSAKIHAIDQISTALQLYWSAPKNISGDL